MRPILFQIGNIGIPSYGVMLVISFLVALWLIKRRARNLGIMPGIIVVASNADKAELLYAAIQRGLVNRLVVDEPLMHKLESLAA